MLVVSTDVLKMHHGHVLEMNMEIQIYNPCPGAGDERGNSA